MIKGFITGLRAIERNDLPQLLEWRNKPEFRKYFREYRELNSDSQKIWFENKVINDISTRMFSIEDLSSKKLIGACGLCYIDWVNRSADFSIYIGINDIYIDDKYAIDASQLMIKYAFEELALHRLWSEIYDTDKSKKEMFKKLGFTLDGTLRESHFSEGIWINSFLFSLLAKEYKN